MADDEPGLTPEQEEQLRQWQEKAANQEERWAKDHEGWGTETTAKEQGQKDEQASPSKK